MNDGGGTGNEGVGRSGGSSHVPLWLTLAFATILLTAYFAVPTFETWVKQAWDVFRSGEREYISDWISQYGIWGPIVLIAAMTLQMFLLVIPSVLVMTVAVVAYGAWWGSVLAITAVVVASTIGYLIGLLLGADFINRLLGGDTADRTRWFVDRYGIWTVIVVRLSPFFSNDAISIVAGALQMNAVKFVSATLIGVSPLVAAIAYVGTHTENMSAVFGWVSAISLLFLIGFVWLDRQRTADS